MDPGLRTPLIDFFRRGEVSRDIRLAAAHGGMAPRALEQVALLLILVDDADEEIAVAARETVDRLPPEPLAAFLTRADVPSDMRAWFAARGVTPAGTPAPGDEPLVAPPAEEDDAPAAGAPVDADAEGTAPSGAAKLAMMGVMEKMKLAMRGTREERAVLIRDPNRLVAASVLSSPKLTEAEVEGFARMANVSEEVLRVIGTNRSWLKNYSVAAGLVRNPKTPLAISLHLLSRLSDRDVKMLTTDRNIPEPLRIAARKRATAGPG